MMRCVAKGSGGDAKRLRESASRLRAMMKVKDELLARQEEMVGLQAVQLADSRKMIDLQAEQIALQAEQLSDRAKLVEVQAEQIGVLEELVARNGGRAGQGAAPDECD